MLAREENKDYFAAYVLVGLGGLWMMSAYSKAGMGICARASFLLNGILLYFESALHFHFLLSSHILKINEISSS